MSNDDYEVEKVLNKKFYDGKYYYQLKWVGSDAPTWEAEDNCNCDKLIEDYERLAKKQSTDEDADEWEVEKILKKRTRGNKVEYLVKWKNWNGDDSWIPEEDCNCINLVAAFENPKLRKLWEFGGFNQSLWLEKEHLLAYLKKMIKRSEEKVNLLDFEADFPADEEPPKLKDGLNMGPLSYKKHWYLVIIIVNHLGVTKRSMIGDPLNTLIGVPRAKVHPVFKRIMNLYPKSYTQAIGMTPMNRSDVCAFYVIAAFERALKLFSKRAKYPPENLFFTRTRAEIFRSRLLPDSDNEISASLPISSTYLDGPKCEFCSKLYDSMEEVDEHIVKRHYND